MMQTLFQNYEKHLVKFGNILKTYKRKEVVESEYFKYYDWAVSMKIIDPNDYEYTQNTYIQFNDKLSFEFSWELENED